MTDAEFCCLCGEECSDTLSLTLMRDTSGSRIRVCRECKDELGTPFCRVCEERIQGRVNYIHLPVIGGEPNSSATVCVACSREIQHSGVER